MKVSYKKSSMVFLSILILLAIGMIFFTKDIREQADSLFINGPKFYPILLACLLILFSIISFIDTWRKEDRVIDLPEIKRPTFILFVTLVWVILWQTIGYFYALSAIAMFVLIIFLNPKPFSLKKAAWALFSDLIVVALLYGVFAIGLKAQL